MASNNKFTDAQKMTYDKSISSLAYEGSLLWSRYNTIFASQAIFLTLLGILMTNHEKLNVSNYLYIFLALFGLIFCLVWFFVTSRGFTWFHYYVYSAREIEEKLNSADFELFKRGEELRRGSTIYFYKKDGESFKCLKRPWYNGPPFLKTEYLAYIPIVIFLLIYIFIIFNISTLL